MRLLPKVREAHIPDDERDIFARYGENVIAQVLAGGYTPRAKDLHSVYQTDEKIEHARDWLTECSDIEARRIREDRLLELAIIALIGVEIFLSVVFFFWGLRESRRAETAQNQAMRTMQQSLETTRQALDRSVALASQQLQLTQGMVDPAVEIALGDVFKPELSNKITIRNTGPQNVRDLSVDLRCFAFRNQYDKTPILFFQGLTTADEKHHWWYTPELRSSGVIQKDVSKAIDSLLSNAELRRKQEPGIAPSGDEINHPLPLASPELFVADFVYHRAADNRKYSESRTGWLFKDSKTGRAVLNTTIPASPDLQNFLSRMP